MLKTNQKLSDFSSSKKPSAGMPIVKLDVQNYLTRTVIDNDFIEKLLQSKIILTFWIRKKVKGNVPDKLTLFPMVFTLACIDI